MADYLETSVELINQKVQFKGSSRDNPPVTIDYIPPQGDGNGYMSLELLLLSLSSCVGTSIISILRKMRKNVSGFKASSKGLRREQHPTSFEVIHLEFSITSPDAVDSDVQRALQLSEESYCPVWAMLKNSVKIETEFKIIAG